jgi:hypothetical protein
VELEPLCLVGPLPETGGKYAQSEKLGAASDLEDSEDLSDRTWHAKLRVIPDSPQWELHVSGAPQHVLAHGTFSGLDEDEERGQYDWREFWFTVCVEDPRHVLVRHPELAPFGHDVIRRLRIEAGDGYKLDWVAPDTFVGLAADGELVTSTGGYVRDDRPALRQAARLAYEWYRQPRQTLTLAAGRVTRALWLGDLIVSLGDPLLGVIGDTHLADVGTCVTEITVEMPLAAGPVAPPRRITWQTGFAELDSLAFAPPRR